MMLQHPDFPPIPKCFSHLVNSTGESHSIQLGSDIAELDLLEQTDSSKESEDFSSNSSKTNKAWIDSGTEHHDKTGLSSCKNRPSDNDMEREPPSIQSQNAAVEVEANGQEVTDPKSPYLKLHSSLLKLQREMKDLRHLDISLFCQLLSLNEAIQDFKMSISDRYSETGSEYSLGTASYMGSMSSLNDESDWGEDGTLLNSLHDLQDGSEAGENTDENSQSASSLLKQITDLALRADEDF